LPASHSAVETFRVRGRTFYVKRDDTIHPLFSGNKYRKLFTLLQTPAERYDRVVSYGGTQSNAMLSIAALAQEKGWRFDYYCRSVPGHLKEAPTGNLKKALELGMNLVEVPHADYEQTIEQLRTDIYAKSCMIPQGGADASAEAGVFQLAEEIQQWQSENGMESLNVVTPSGTGTTAYYLAKALPDLTIVTSAVVGGSDYLREQMLMLGPLPKNLIILQPKKKHHFAKPYPELLNCYRELLDAGLEVDLIYGAKMWHDLLEQEGMNGMNVLYIHSGGLIGNETMLERYRYRYKGML
jgi:1-aminocyclopropane-1-carboxylate deaminase/D-cysteine desulfhydrase-like pyridoxal-dependent ACC family enzyme